MAFGYKVDVRFFKWFLKKTQIKSELPEKQPESILPIGDTRL